MLNEYKLYVDVSLIFDSSDDFLYRQKGQLKIDNTVVEAFLPILVRKCIQKEFGTLDVNIEAQVSTFSSAYFASSLGRPNIGGGLTIKMKDQDFAMTRTLYLASSFDEAFGSEATLTFETELPYVVAEIKTNLDKTMYQEAAATAHDVKMAVSGAKYYLICDFLDMKPVSTAATDIDEVLILRKAKRIDSSVHRTFNQAAGRRERRNWYVGYLTAHPYSANIFERLIGHILDQAGAQSLTHEDVLATGSF